MTHTPGIDGSGQTVAGWYHWRVPAGSAGDYTLVFSLGLPGVPVTCAHVEVRVAAKRIGSGPRPDPNDK